MSINGVEIDPELLEQYGGWLWRDSLDTGHTRELVSQSAQLPAWVFGELPESAEWSGNWNRFLDNRLREGATLATELGGHAGKVLQVSADHSATDEQAARSIDSAISDQPYFPDSSYEIPRLKRGGEPPSPDLNLGPGESGVGDLMTSDPKSGDADHVTKVPFPKPQPYEFFIPSPAGYAAKALLHEFATVAEVPVQVPDFRQQSEADDLDRVMAAHGTSLVDAEVIAKAYGATISDDESPLKRFIIPAWKSSPKMISTASDNLREFGTNGFYQNLSDRFGQNTKHVKSNWDSEHGSDAWHDYATTTGEYIGVAKSRMDGLADYGRDISHQLSSIRDACAAAVSQKAEELEKAKGQIYQSLADTVGAITSDPVGVAAAGLKSVIVGITHHIQQTQLAELKSSTESRTLRTQVNTPVVHDPALEAAAPFPHGDAKSSWESRLTRRD